MSLCPGGEGPSCLTRFKLFEESFCEAAPGLIINEELKSSSPAETHNPD